MNSNQFSSNKYLQTTKMPDSSFNSASEGFMPRPKNDGKRKKNINLCFSWVLVTNFFVFVF